MHDRNHVTRITSQDIRAGRQTRKLIEDILTVSRTEFISEPNTDHAVINIVQGLYKHQVPLVWIPYT